MIRRILLLVLVILLISPVFFYFQFQPASKIRWGLNFSIEQASYLGFDWRQMYVEILDDLKPKRLRIMAYWEILEPVPGRFNFGDIDFLLEEAEERNVQAILVLGQKQPRWPECHHPAWYENLTVPEQQAAVLAMLQTAVNHFKPFSSIRAWQVENEPFFPYGPRCGSVPKDFLKQELALVKSLDARPIVVTDSGEKGDWLRTAFAGGEVFGSTMYRQVYHDKKQRYIRYPIPPALYRLKAGIVKTFSNIDEFIGVELQGEPWFATDVFQTPWARQAELMNPRIFSEYVEYARRVGFAENYFWGVEWWYWARAQGHPELWDSAKQILSD